MLWFAGCHCIDIFKPISRWFLLNAGPESPRCKYNTYKSHKQWLCKQVWYHRGCRTPYRTQGDLFSSSEDACRDKVSIICSRYLPFAACYWIVSRGKMQEAENPLVTNDCHTPPLTEALRPEQRQAQQRDFEGLLQELADKYIYTEESLQPNDAYSDCSLDLPMQARKQYVSPKLRVLQTSFRDVLDAVVIAATARAALLSHLQEQSWGILVFNIGSNSRQDLQKGKVWHLSTSPYCQYKFSKIICSLLKRVANL